MGGQRSPQHDGSNTRFWRVPLDVDKMERLEIRPERLQLEWISAAEGQKWAKTMKELEEMRSRVTQEEVTHTMKVLKEERLKSKARQETEELKKKVRRESPVEAMA
ncbi:MAG: hydrogenase iron-sulfur subunit [Candidatus Neomarinimicrobiota bacterium]